MFDTHRTVAGHCLADHHVVLQTCRSSPQSVFLMGKELQLKQDNFSSVLDDTTQLPDGVEPQDVVGVVRVRKRGKIAGESEATDNRLLVRS